MPRGHSRAMSSPQERPPFMRRRSTLVGAITLTLGIAICVVLVRELGAQALWVNLVALSATVPALLLLEAGRFLAELISARLVLAPWHAQDVPRLSLLRGQCLAHACNKVMPAGRAVGEGLKAAILTPSIGAARAVGVGGASQIMTLLVNGAFALLASAIAIGWLGGTREGGILASYGCATVALGVLVVVSLRSAFVARLLGRFAVTASLSAPFAQAVAHGTGFGAAALSCHALAKLLQAIQLGVLLWAVGVGVRPDLALFAEGVQIVGAAAGDLVPAQLGATEGAFALSSGTLGLSAQASLSVAVVLHSCQLMFAAVLMLASVPLRMLESPRGRPQEATQHG